MIHIDHSVVHLFCMKGLTEVNAEELIDAMKKSMNPRGSEKDIDEIKMNIEDGIVTINGLGDGRFELGFEINKRIAAQNFKIKQLEADNRILREQFDTSN